MRILELSAGLPVRMFDAGAVVLDQGGACGEMSVLLDTPYTATVRALKSSRIDALNSYLIAFREYRRRPAR